MQISANVNSQKGTHSVSVSTEGHSKAISIPPKPAGGSSINGGELLFLALATCFCNDIHREAAKRKIVIESVDVTVDGQFGAEGEPGTNITYKTKVVAPSLTSAEIQDLISYVDRIAEIHNTLRRGAQVTLTI